MRLTPIEKAISGTVDRKVAYEARQRAAGLVKVTRWVSAARLAALDEWLRSEASDASSAAPASRQVVAK